MQFVQTRMSLAVPIRFHCNSFAFPLHPPNYILWQHPACFHVIENPLFGSRCIRLSVFFPYEHHTRASTTQSTSRSPSRSKHLSIFFSFYSRFSFAFSFWFGFLFSSYRLPSTWTCLHLQCSAAALQWKCPVFLLKSFTSHRFFNYLVSILCKCRFICT